MDSKRNNGLIKYKASELNINFPDNNNLEPAEIERTKNSIINGGVVKPDGRCFVTKESTQIQLCTDKKGSNIFYNDLENEDKFNDGNKKYASVSSVSKEISERIQQPRDPLIHEKLKYSEDCLKAFRDDPKLTVSRQIEDARIKKQLPNLTKEKMKDEKISNCQLTNSEFNNDAEGHHIIRKADNPRLALDPQNLAVVKKAVHNTIHEENAESPKKLKELCIKKGWNTLNL